MNVAKSYNRRGLVGHWKYHGNVSALGTWYDISGNGNHGTLVGNAVVDNQGLNLDGSGDYVDCGNVGSFSELTLCAWIKPTSLLNEYSGIISTPRWGSAGYVHFSFEYDRPSVYIHQGGSSRAIALGTSVSTNVSIFITATIKNGASGLKIYKNAVLEDTDDVYISNFIYTTTYIGYEEVSRYLNGFIPYASIYNRALSASEIKQLYHQTRR